MKQLNDENFETEIQQGVHVVDFYADWCGPCRMMAPVIEEVEKELEGSVSFAKLDIDQNTKTAGQYQVTSIPTLILYKDGREVNRLVGLRDAAAIKQFATSS